MILGSMNAGTQQSQPTERVNVLFKLFILSAILWWFALENLSWVAKRTIIECAFENPLVFRQLFFAAPSCRSINKVGVVGHM
jgi:hypothetical protein